MSDPVISPIRLSDRDYHAIALAVDCGQICVVDTHLPLQPILERLILGKTKSDRVDRLRSELEESPHEWNVTQIVNAVIKIDTAWANNSAYSRRQLWTGTELHSEQFPDPEWIVEGMIPTGLTVLAGKPKIGKSWFALQLSKSITEAERFLSRDVSPGKVLYLGLEDNPRRMRKRMFEIQKWRATDQITLGYELPSDSDPCQYVADLIREMRPKLVVIDTLSRFVPAMDQNKAYSVTAIFGVLHRIASNEECGILVVHHMKKGESVDNEDWVDQVTGSVAISAIPDAVLGMTRSRGTDGAILKGIGRDFEHDVDLALEFDKDTCTWDSLGNSSEILTKGSFLEIVDILNELGEANQTTIADTLKRDAGNISKRLAELTDLGSVIYRKGKGNEKVYSVNKDTTYTTRTTSQ
jgi:hypothetical protein